MTRNSNIARYVSASVNFRMDTLLRIAWAIVIAMLLVLALNSFVEVPGRDSSAYMYVAKGILEGEIPYLDRWDHKGPLLYLVNLIGLALFDVWGVWLAQLIFLISWVWIAFTLAKDNFGLVPALFSLAALLSYFVLIDVTNSPGIYAITLQFLALYLFVRVERGEGGPRSILAIGALSASAFLLLPSLVGLWIAIGLYWIIRRENALVRILLAVAGALPVFILAIGAFAAVGGLYAMWDAVFVYNLAYTDVSFAERLKAILEPGIRKTIFLLPLAGVWCVGLCYFLFAKSTRQDRFESMLKFALIALPIEIVLISLSAFGHLQYYLSLLPVVMILMAFLSLFIDRIVRNIPLASRVNPGLVGIVILGAASMYLFTAAGLGYLATIHEKYTREGGIMRGSHARMVEFIREETDPDDTILVYGGGETRLHLFSGRDAPTRFFYQYPLAMPGYARPEIFDEFIQDIRIGKPAFIIDTRKGRLPPLDNAERERWEISSHRYIYLPDEFRPFLELVSSDYQRMADIDDYAVYRRIEGR